jgi:fatty-acyl-CoA synthase
MKGYYGMPEATGKTIGEDGWLHSGDMGMMDDRGYLKITGRIKDMIIRGGMNLYPREIEDVLFQHPQVSQVAVVGLPDPKWGEIIAAVIIPSEGNSLPAPGELFACCRQHLAPHKSPEQWFFVEAFPLTPSGKIQKFVLQEWIAEGKISAAAWDKDSARARAKP